MSRREPLNLSFDARDRMKAGLLADLEEVRVALEAQQSADSTNFLRGQIFALRSVLEWIAPPPPKKPEPEHRRLFPTPD